MNSRNLAIYIDLEPSKFGCGKWKPVPSESLSCKQIQMGGAGMVLWPSILCQELSSEAFLQCAFSALTAWAKFDGTKCAMTAGSFEFIAKGGFQSILSLRAASDVGANGQEHPNNVDVEVYLLSNGTRRVS